MIRVKKNTYPRHKNVAHAEPGDRVRWERRVGGYDLVNDAGETVFSMGGIRPDGAKYSNGDLPKLIGVIAEVKKNGWKLELEET